MSGRLRDQRGRRVCQRSRRPIPGSVKRCAQRYERWLGSRANA